MTDILDLSLQDTLVIFVDALEVKQLNLPSQLTIPQRLGQSQNGEHPSTGIPG